MAKPKMKGFFLAAVNMGIIKLPDIESYWKTSLVSEVPFFRMLMPRDRFQEIFWMLQVSHCDPCRPAKKIDRIKQLLLVLLTKFRDCPKTSPLMKLWLDFVVILVPNSMHQKKKQSNGASRRSTWLIPRMGRIYNGNLLHRCSGI